MGDNDDVSRLATRVEELLSGDKDNSWPHWSQYVLKAIEEISKDLKNMNVSRETILIKLAELNSSVERIEKTIHDFGDFKEKIIAPLRIKVAVLAIVCGFLGGIIAACIPVVLKYILGVSG